MQVTEHFNSFEFNCHDLTPYPSVWYVSRLEPLCKQLEVLRFHVSHPVLVLSGFRTPTYNARVGGKVGSMHLEGIAADIHVPGKGAEELWEIMNQLVASGGVMDGGIGKYSWGIHYDIRTLLGKRPSRW
jgi:uncharacterized protein YcbK (DUF882 family)